MCLLNKITEKIRQYRLKSITRDKTSKQESVIRSMYFMCNGYFLRLISLVTVSDIKKKTHLKWVE